MKKNSFETLDDGFVNLYEEGIFVRCFEYSAVLLSELTGYRLFANIDKKSSIIFLEVGFPKKQRYFFRKKIERLFFDLFENVYKYMYNIGDRKDLIEKIFSSCMVLREFFRFLYKIGKIKNDNVYLDLGDRWIEVLKICKSIKEKS